MPIPILVAAGVAGFAGVIGVGGHISAKDTNEKAERISRDAKSLYNEAKESLEEAQKNTERALMDLGYAKKNVLDSSISQFIRAYDRIKQIELRQSEGSNEISHFEIEQNDMIQLQEMVDIYSGSVTSGTAGAAAGAIVALAASGSLPIVTSTLSLAGTVLALGDIGGAIGIAGTALSTAATMTPLAAVAAPIVLFTGISASMKADENLEKAETMYAEAEAAAEKMKASETLCKGIIDRSEMFDKLLNELNGMFAQCVNLLDMVTMEMIRQLGREITVTDLTNNEKKLIMVTRALAGAVKAVIDTPILSENGELSNKVEKLHTEIRNSIPEFTQEVKEVNTVDFKKEIMTAKLLAERPPEIAMPVADQTKSNYVRPVVAAEMIDIDKGQKKINRKAVMSLILGILSWVGIVTVVGSFLSIIGGIWSVIDGIRALKGKTKYRKCAIAGIILSSIIIILFVFIMILLFI